MDYLSIRQISEKWGISKRRIQILCSQGRIEGAVKIDSSWVIPHNAMKPQDMRIKNGLYIQKKEVAGRTK